jgi:hypothetical protein
MQEVPRENLVPGKEYYIENPVYRLKRIAKFDKLLIYDGVPSGGHVLIM